MRANDERRATASATSTPVAPRYIGFRVKLYGPVCTNVVALSVLGSMVVAWRRNSTVAATSSTTEAPAMAKPAIRDFVVVAFRQIGRASCRERGRMNEAGASE